MDTLTFIHSSLSSAPSALERGASSNTCLDQRKCFLHPQIVESLQKRIPHNFPPKRHPFQARKLFLSDLPPHLLPLQEIQDEEDSQKKRNHPLKRKARSKRKSIKGRQAWIPLVPPETPRKFHININGKLQTLNQKDFESFLCSIQREMQILDSLVFPQEKIKDLIRQPRGPQGPQITPSNSPAVYLQHISSQVGWGLFAKESISAGTVIGEYTGLVLPLGGGTYAMDYPVPGFPQPQWEIDASYYGNEMRFINHSFYPNVDYCISIDSQGIPHIILIAAQDISEKDQFLIDYGNNYWQGLNPEPLNP